MTFNDDKYWEHVFGCDKDQVNTTVIKSAHKLANECRDKEIDRSWERGKYFWAFILASYTAHFSILGKIFDLVKSDISNNLSQGMLNQIPYVMKLMLLITSFFATFFCISWILINKGSKFWQKNWESHVDMLEDVVAGKLYKTYLNTEDKTEFSKCLFCNLKAYDYSVSRITLFGSIILSFVSFMIFAFDCALCIPCFEHLLRKIENWCFFQTVITVAVVTVFLAFLLNLFDCKGNEFDENNEEKWFQKKIFML